MHFYICFINTTPSQRSATAILTYLPLTVRKNYSELTLACVKVALQECAKGSGFKPFLEGDM